jgi:hypothetical protein
MPSALVSSRQTHGQNLRKMNGGAPRHVLDLLAATEAVRDDQRAGRPFPDLGH